MRPEQAELNNLLAGTKAVRSFNSLRVDDLREGLRVLDESETRLAQLATARAGLANSRVQTACSPSASLGVSMNKSL